MKKNLYVLESPKESKRLESQASLPVYDIEEELSGLHPEPGARILDAGCGTGAVARKLAELFPSCPVEACDLSDLRLQDARKLTANSLGIRYYRSDLVKIESQVEVYGLVTCRYVLEHLPEPVAALKEFRRVLKPGGTACIMDFDGLVFNLFPMSAALSEMVEKLKSGLPVDLYVGRKIPSMLHAAGFSKIRCRVAAQCFSGENLEAERKMNEERIALSMPAIEKVLGSESRALEFKERYLEELMRPGATHFWNKFVVHAEKD